MTVYRITSAEWSKHLNASGNPARWNSKGIFIVYTAQSRALACLGNLVHRNGEGCNDIFKVMLIEIPESIKIEIQIFKNLKQDWNEINNYAYCQSIGENWIKDSKTAVIRVPSAIVKQEFNYLINPNHADFKKIKLIGVEDFDFDKRF